MKYEKCSARFRSFQETLHLRGFVQRAFEYHKNVTLEETCSLYRNRQRCKYCQESRAIAHESL